MERELNIKNLSITYKGSGENKKICENVNLEFKSGEIVGVVGANGTGKTTLFKSILSKLDFEGKIVFNNFQSPEPKISYIPQDYKSSFFKWTSLLNNIKFSKGEFFQNWKSYEDEIKNIQQLLGVNFDFNIKPKECSGGMLQQAAITRALFSEEGVIIADEPFSALDLNICSSIRSRFKKVVKDKKIICLVILHNLEDIKAICDRVLYLPNKPYTTNVNSPNKIIEYLNIEDELAINTNESLSDIMSKIFKPV